jgi:hypothetical protein
MPLSLIQTPGPPQPADATSGRRRQVAECVCVWDPMGAHLAQGGGCSGGVGILQHRRNSTTAAARPSARSPPGRRLHGPATAPTAAASLLLRRRRSLLLLRLRLPRAQQRRVRRGRARLGRRSRRLRLLLLLLLLLRCGTRPRVSALLLLLLLLLLRCLRHRLHLSDKPPPQRTATRELPDTTSLLRWLPPAARATAGWWHGGVALHREATPHAPRRHTGP